MPILDRLRQFLTPDAGFHLVRLDRLQPEDVAAIVASRRRRNGATLPVMAALTAGLVALQFGLIGLEPALAKAETLRLAYLVTFGLTFLSSLAWFLFWKRRPGAGGQGTWVHSLLAFGVATTLCDLQITGDYSSFILVLFGIALLYSAPLTWYLAAFGGAWAALLVGILVLDPPGIGVNPVGSSAVMVVVGVTAALILETRRVRTELLNLELGRRTRQWKEASLRDDLTGLHNRRFLFEWMGHQMAQARRSGRPLAVGLLDLDHFKLVNDTAGHGVGDEVLKAAALWLRQGVRDADLVARFGGEEFVVVLPGAGLDEARVVLERCLGSFRSGAVPGWTGPVTFSAGLVILGPEETEKEVFHRADLLLYAAKARGRNRIVASDEPEERLATGRARP